MINGVFLDASFWVVYRDEDEAAHPAARKVMNDLHRQRAHFFTTLPVVCEIHAYFSRNRRMRELVLADFSNNPLVAVEEVSGKDYDAAVGLLNRHLDKSYSLCDAISFIVMRRLRLVRVATFDGHFRQFGEFEILSPELSR